MDNVRMQDWVKLEDGKWHLIVMVYDKDKEKVETFLDGVSITPINTATKKGNEDE